MLKVKLLFDVCCYIATLILFVQCLYMYYKNDDVSEILYKEYNEDLQSPYPSISFCFDILPNLVEEDAFNKVGDGINGNTYTDFLTGNHWDKRMLNISYDETTKSLDKYLIHSVVSDNFNLKENNIINQEKMRISTLPSYYTIYKCITFDMPSQLRLKLKLGSMVISNSIFRNRSRPEDKQLFSSIHLPN